MMYAFAELPGVAQGCVMLCQFMVGICLWWHSHQNMPSRSKARDLRLLCEYQIAVRVHIREIHMDLHAL